MKTFLQQLKIEFLMYTRNPGALGWGFAFPICIILLFGFMFGKDRDISFGVGLVDEDKTESSQVLVTTLKNIKPLFRIEEGKKEDLLKKVEENKKSCVIEIPKGFSEGMQKDSVLVNVIYNPYQVQTNQIILSVMDKVVTEFNHRLKNFHPTIRVNQIKSITVKSQKSYIDFLVPGVIALQIMSMCLWGIGFVMITYREKGNLKRFAVTPIKKSIYIAAQLVNRYFIIVAQALVILLMATLVFKIRMEGSVIDFFLMLTLGMFAFMALGFMVAAFSKNIETSIGVVNVLFLVMMFLSGVYFPVDNMPVFLAPVVKGLPLTHLVNSLRGIFMEGNSLWHYYWEMLVLGVWLIGSFTLSIKFFKWT